ncbi:hypothetical protein [Streptomyces californicus]|uniref:hypothetical protein n=1 Tax=Streptomyces californicus TaxID=67351 RepID=UPI00296F1CB3|nr:hypothetical protein [Streptomyces californicus]MDW4912582.1 hypothetical protein [Streptomyces californicus]
MALTAVTLADGTPAAVHTVCTGGYPGRAGSSLTRDRLTAETLHLVEVEGMLKGCPAVREAAHPENLVVEESPQGGLFALMRVLCTSPACREFAEQTEEPADDLDQAAAADVRAWALTQQPQQ